MRVVDRTKPDEIYNLAAQSFVALSLEEPVYTGDVNALAVARLLEAVRHVRFLSGINVRNVRQRAPPSPERNDAVLPAQSLCKAKLYAHRITVNYRES
jgi:GDPmannose 4,6-dehydratase